MPTKGVGGTVDERCKTELGACQVQLETSKRASAAASKVAVAKATARATGKEPLLQAKISEPTAGPSAEDGKPAGGATQAPAALANAHLQVLGLFASGTNWIARVLALTFPDIDVGQQKLLTAPSQYFWKTLPLSAARDQKIFWRPASISLC